MVFNMPIKGPLECFYKYAIFINIEIRKKKYLYCMSIALTRATFNCKVHGAK